MINSFKYVCAQPTWHARLAPIGGSAPLSKPLTCSVHARPTTAAVTLTPPAGTQRQGERSGAAERLRSGQRKCPAGPPERRVTIDLPDRKNQEGIARLAALEEQNTEDERWSQDFEHIAVLHPFG